MYQVQQIRFKKRPTSWFTSVTVKHRVITAIKCARQDANNRGSSRYPPGIEDIGFNMLQGESVMITARCCVCMLKGDIPRNQCSSLLECLQAVPGGTY